MAYILRFLLTKSIEQRFIRYQNHASYRNIRMEKKIKKPSKFNQSLSCLFFHVTRNGALLYIFGNYYMLLRMSLCVFLIVLVLSPNASCIPILLFVIRCFPNSINGNVYEIFYFLFKWIILSDLFICLFFTHVLWGLSRKMVHSKFYKCVPLIHGMFVRMYDLMSLSLSHSFFFGQISWWKVSWQYLFIHQSCASASFIFLNMA